jgi:outer membrane receptor protein involved in Fe transport
MGNAVVNDWLRLRGGFNRATRAPNLGELFLNTQEIFTIGGVNFGDPCGLRSGAPWGAGGAAPDPILDVGEPETEIASGQTAAGALSTMLICQAQMGGPGSTGATAYYGGNATGAGAGGAFNWVLQAGNPNLKSEEADTFTAGFVMNSPWDNPWLDGVSLTMDWWMVDISDAIQLYSIDYARNLCYGSITVTDAAGAAAQAATPECMAVGRDLANGNSTTITIGYDNQATLSTSGIDFAGNWMAQLEDLGFGVPGGVSVNVQATWLDYYKTKQSPLPFDVETDWAGSLGPNLTGTNAGAYDYRIFSNFTYFRDRWSVSLRWRHMPSVWSAAYASERAIIENNQSGGTILSYTPRTDIKTDAYNVVDLSFNWQINDMFSLRGGINNLFDSDPEVINATVGYPTGTDRSVCGSAPGCVNPGGPSLGDPSLGVTNAGYYDGFGRRFFVGLKASF